MPYPRLISRGAFEIGTAKFGHPAQNADTSSGFCFLVFESARLSLGPDHDLPATHLGFYAAALIVTRCLLPCHPTVRPYVGNMAITNAQAPGGVGAQDSILGRWDRNVDRRTKTFCKSRSRWLAIISTICNKYLNRVVDLIQ